MSEAWLTGQEFRDQMIEKFDLDPADRVLVDAIAATLDDAMKSRSYRDRRAGLRLVNEQIRTLFARQAAQEGEKPTRSEAARKLALQRWHGAA
jgi:hypothetical protein